MEPTDIIEFEKGGGLVTAIAQDVHDKEVLMLAWMNAESLDIFTDRATGASGWLLTFADCRFHLVLSPELTIHRMELAGGRVDTAGQLRGICGMALVETHHPRALPMVAELLNNQKVTRLRHFH